MDSRTAQLNSNQLRLQAIKDDEKLQKARNAYLFQHKVRILCKFWGGPCTSIGELEIALARVPKPEQVDTQEITYCKLSLHINLNIQLIDKNSESEAYRMMKN